MRNPLNCGKIYIDQPGTILKERFFLSTLQGDFRSEERYPFLVVIYEILD
jgi:hypothetical protein